MKKAIDMKNLDDIKNDVELIISGKKSEVHKKKRTNKVCK